MNNMRKYPLGEQCGSLRFGTVPKLKFAKHPNGSEPLAENTRTEDSHAGDVVKRSNL